MRKIADILDGCSWSELFEQPILKAKWQFKQVISLTKM